MENNHRPLKVKIVSFSFKKGYPIDESGNGGGFVFDCRMLHNPGKYENLKNFTGLDKEVIDFLKDREEVKEFCQNIVAITDKAVKKYEKRGFENLQICFGCTGGRHRSVYCAEVTALFLRQNNPKLIIEINHREQGIVKTI